LLSWTKHSKMAGCAERGVRISLRLLDELQEAEARTAALELLAKLGLAPRYEELLAHLKSEGFEERKEAIKALWYLAESEGAKGLQPDPTDVLLGLAEDENKWTRWYAVVGLKLGLGRAEGESWRVIAEALCERSRDDPSKEVRRQAQSGLEAASVECDHRGDGRP